MREKIIEELNRIEKEEHIKILLAVESGSRAWGFAGSDSDYDVRFIYVRDEDFYLRLDETRDVLEYPINDLLDINGWDISKTLKLIYSSNPTLFEWFESPIVYITTPEIEKLRKIAKNYFSKVKTINHYYRIALEHYDNYIRNKDEIRIKKYFYVLRALSAAKYVLENNTNPPIEFDNLRNIGIPSEYNHIVDELLDMKINNSEKKIISRNKELDAYIENEFNKLDKIVHELVKEDDKDWNLLNDYFKKVIKSED